MRNFGALGDAATDDTPAFVAAAAAAAPTGGCVRVPPVVNGGGYVLTDTVVLEPGVRIIGSLAGFVATPHCYGPPGDVNTTGGSRILARPSPASYNTTARTGSPLFHLTGTGCGVRGLFILYDRMPFPTDAEFAPRSGSSFAYASFDAARDRFVDEHVPPVGPTIYVTHGVRVQVRGESRACRPSHCTLVHLSGGRRGGRRLPPPRLLRGWRPRPVARAPRARRGPPKRERTRSVAPPQRVT